MEKNFFTLTEACNYLGIKKSWMYHLTHKKKISHYKPTGKLLYFTKKDLDDFVLSCRIKSDEEILSGRQRVA